MSDAVRTNLNRSLTKAQQRNFALRMMDLSTVSISGMLLFHGLNNSKLNVFGSLEYNYYSSRGNEVLLYSRSRKKIGERVVGKKTT